MALTMIMEIRKLLLRIKCIFVIIFIGLIFTQNRVNAQRDKFTVVIRDLEYKKEDRQLKFKLVVHEDLTVKPIGIDKIYILYNENIEKIKEFKNLTTYFDGKINLRINEKLKADGIEIMIYDKTGKIYKQRVEGIKIDNEEPKIYHSFCYDNIIFKGNKAYVSGKVILKYKVEDENLLSIKFGDDEIKKEGEIRFEDGIYPAEIIAVDSFHNEKRINLLDCYDVKEFEVDNIKPAITIQESGKNFVNADYSIHIEVYDKNLDESLLDAAYIWKIRDGKAETEVNIDDNKLRTVEVGDIVGNKTVKNLPSITIDKKKPILEIRGYKEISEDEDILNIYTEDENFNGLRINISGENYEKNLNSDDKNISLPMNFLPYKMLNLDITSIDKAGNISEFRGMIKRRKKNIEVLYTGTLTDIKRYKYTFNHPYKICKTELCVYRNGNEEIFPVQIIGNDIIIPKVGYNRDGEYRLELIIGDELGTEKRVEIDKFIVDTQKPVIKKIGNSMIIYDNRGIKEIEILYENKEEKKIRDISSSHRYVLEDITGMKAIRCTDVGGNIAIKNFTAKENGDNDIDNLMINNSPKYYIYVFSILFLTALILNVLFLIKLYSVKYIR